MGITIWGNIGFDEGKEGGSEKNHRMGESGVPPCPPLWETLVPKPSQVPTGDSVTTCLVDLYFQTYSE